MLLRLALLALLACNGRVADDTSDTSDTSDTAGSDADEDGLPDADEAAAGCDPADADSDDDGVPDGAEVEAGTDCADPDSDADGLCDGDRFDNDEDGVDPASDCTLSEGWFGCDPLVEDSDSGGTSDFVEGMRHGTDCQDGEDDTPLCTPNWDWEQWDGGDPLGFELDAGISVNRSTSALAGDFAGELNWSGTDPLYVAFGEPVPTSTLEGTSCMFRAWVDDSDANVQIKAAVRHVSQNPDGSWKVDSTTVGQFGSGNAGWQEVVATFSCGNSPVQPVLQLTSISGAAARAKTDVWLLHAIDNTFAQTIDGATDAGARALQSPDGPEDLFVLLRSESVTQGQLYVSGPWARPDKDRGLLVWAGGVDDSATVPAPWDKAGSVPASEDRLLALMQEGTDPATAQWYCAWLEWSPSGQNDWVELSTACSGGSDATAGDRLEGVFDFVGSLDEGWPATFALAAVEWQSTDNGALVPSEQIPEGDGDGTLEDDEALGPLGREALFRSVAVPCDGVGDPEGCLSDTGAPASTCTGNLLAAGGFESGTYTPGLPSQTGRWGGDLAAIEGFGTCMGPLEGDQWLTLKATDAFGASADDRAEAIQLLDVTARRGETLAISADVVRTLRVPGADTFFGLEVWFYDGTPTDFPLSWSRGLGTVIGRRGAPTQEEADAPYARAHPEVEVTVPEGGGEAFVAVVVFALEDVANEVTGEELAGHHVDDVCVVAVAR